MGQTIICHRGKCLDRTDTFFTRFEDNYDQDDIIDRIEFDMIKDEIDFANI